MSGRQVISQDELVSVLNRELSKCPECEGVQVNNGFAWRCLPCA